VCVGAGGGGLDFEVKGWRAGGGGIPHVPPPHMHMHFGFLIHLSMFAQSCGQSMCICVSCYIFSTTIQQKIKCTKAYIIIS
jgi:hypothetical protein